MKHYIALIRKGKGTCYGVDFPDFPGCITSANTVEEVQARAVSVLDFHVDGMVEDGETLPKATGLDAILEDPENCDGLVLAVQVPLADKKRMVNNMFNIELTVFQICHISVYFFIYFTCGFVLCRSLNF